MDNSKRLVIRSATAADIPQIMALIRELAEYEKLSHEVEATEESLRELLFGPCPAAEALFAEYDGEPAGYALYFTSVSTFLGRRGIYLEDIYVRPHLRRQGIGKTLLIKVVQIAVERGCGRLEWCALNWNTPAIDFYKGIGAVPLEDWTTFRLTGDALMNVAESA